MTTAVQEIEKFFADWENLTSMRRAFEERFTADTEWVNVGLSRAVGLDAALRLMDGFNERFNVVRSVVIVDHMAGEGNVVLNERSDIFYDADGKEVLNIKVVGVFEMDGPRIVRWRDYCDTKAYASGAATATA